EARTADRQSTRTSRRATCRRRASAGSGIPTGRPATSRRPGIARSCGTAFRVAPSWFEASAMRPTNLLRGLMAGLGILAAIGMSGCTYPVPVTEAATRGVEPGLVGEWMSADGKNRLEVRRYDDRNAVVVLNGLVLRAYHSEVAGLPLVTLQELESPERKY